MTQSLQNYIAVIVSFNVVKSNNTRKIHRPVNRSRFLTLITKSITLEILEFKLKLTTNLPSSFRPIW